MSMAFRWRREALCWLVGLKRKCHRLSDFMTDPCQLSERGRDFPSFLRSTKKTQNWCHFGSPQLSRHSDENEIFWRNGQRPRAAAVTKFMTVWRKLRKLKIVYCVKWRFLSRESFHFIRKWMWKWNEKTLIAASQAHSTRHSKKDRSRVMLELGDIIETQNRKKWQTIKTHEEQKQRWVWKLQWQDDTHNKRVELKCRKAPEKLRPDMAISTRVDFFFLEILQIFFHPFDALLFRSQFARLTIYMQQFSID